METDRPQHERPTAYVIAQQYSSATLISLRFHSCKEKFLRFPKKKKILSIFLVSKNSIILRLRF
jgi:hypothetical protein